MTRTMSTKGQALLDDLPPYYAESEFAKGVLDPLGRELQRVDDAAHALVNQAFPTNATDTYNLLPIWEAQCDLPVSPAGSTMTQRRNNVLAHMRSRSKGAGANWVNVMSTQMGLTPSQWSYHEGAGDYTLLIVLPFGSGSYSATQTLAFARKVTPANLIINVVYDVGFLVGFSQLNVRAL